MALKNEIIRAHIQSAIGSGVVVLILTFADGATVAIQISTIELLNLLEQGVLIENE